MTLFSPHFVDGNNNNSPLKSSVLACVSPKGVKKLFLNHSSKDSKLIKASKRHVHSRGSGSVQMCV